MFTVVQKFFGAVKDRWSSVGPAVQLIIAVFAILIPALATFWLVDKLFVYVLARSYVDDVADVFDLNKHLTKAIALAVFVAAVYFIGKTFSRSRTSRRIGYLGIVGLLIGHSLLLWKGTERHIFDRSGNAIKCYVITHTGEVRWGEHPGIDPTTGRPCREVTRELADRLIVLTTQPGRGPQRIPSHDPTFFDPRSGEPTVWYSKDKNGSIEIFDLMGFQPDTGEELHPITRDIADLWKAQNHSDPPPQRIDDPERFGFFDAVTGKPRVWYWRGTNGEYEFYDNRGYHPRTGEQLAVVTKEVSAAWKRAVEAAEKKELEKRVREERDHQTALEQERKRAEQEERFRQAALEQERRKQEELAAEQKRDQEAALLCDQLAANPTDPRKPADVSGVRYDDLKTQAKAAVDACMRATRIYPDDQHQRYRYQYARALQGDEPEKALALHKELARNNYPASFDNAGWLLIRTRNDYQQAIQYFKDGVRRGDPDSAVSLAYMIERQYYVPESDPTATRFALLSWAAQRAILGHSSPSSGYAPKFSNARSNNKISSSKNN
jgi:hypothetical protein